MNAVKHTPGPWEILPIKGKHYGTNIKVDDNYTITVWNNDNGIPSKRWLETYKDNEEGLDPFDSNNWSYLDVRSDCHFESKKDYYIASLIAAAPELLAALKALVEIANYAPGKIKESQEAFQNARKAIAKAEGER